MLVFERVTKQIEAQDENDSLLQKEVFQKARKKLKEKLVFGVVSHSHLEPQFAQQRVQRQALTHLLPPIE